MAQKMEVEIVSRETIKPSSPTPPHLKTYNLSFLDQFSPKVYISILLFYPAICDKDNEKIDNISKCLKSSLSNTLTRFYPFAGRINDSATSIECNDEGAIFIEARVRGSMASVLEKYDISLVKKFRLCGNHHKVPEVNDPLVHVQANFFECGGLVICLSISHKLADASTMGTFIKAWSATSLNSDESNIGFADFNMASIVPALNVPSLPRAPHNIDFSRELPGLEVKRCVFDATKISLLKEKAINEGIKNPTRVECVSALLWKCIRAASRSRFGVERHSKFFQAVNLRTRTIPQLPMNSIGNMVALGIGNVDRETTQTGLGDLIMFLRKGLHDLSKFVANGLKAEETALYLHETGKEVIEELSKNESFASSSWCRFSLYEADFGWGKPTWICPWLKNFMNGFLFVDTRDGGGIEAWCTLFEEDIAFLEQDKEFLSFAKI